MTSGRFVGGWGDVPLLPTPESGPEIILWNSQTDNNLQNA